MSNDINSVLSQIRALQSQIKPMTPAATPALSPAAATQPSAAGSFSNVLRQGLDQVNQAQKSADVMATAFERGTPGVELPQVMLEMQKASVSFRAVTEVRNRMVNAYQEIMNMPI